MLHIGDAKGADHVTKGIFHHFGLGAASRALPFGPILEFAIGPPPYRKKVSEPWHYIMFLLMPARGTGFQDFIVVLFGLLYNPLKADVSTNLVTMVITGEEGQQPGHPAVSVPKWVDAEEVHYKARCRQKRGDMQLVDGMAIRQAQLLHRPWNAVGSQRPKADHSSPDMGNALTI